MQKHPSILLFYAFLGGMAAGAVSVILNSIPLWIALFIASACIALLVDVTRNRRQRPRPAPAVQRVPSRMPAPRRQRAERRPS